MGHRIINSVFFTTSDPAPLRGLAAVEIAHLSGDVHQITIPKHAVLRDLDELEALAKAASRAIEKGERVVISTCGTVGEDALSVAVSRGRVLPVAAIPCVHLGKGRYVPAHQWLAAKGA